MRELTYRAFRTHTDHMSTHITETAWVPTDTFANRLVLVRRELDITVREAADRTGLHYATWSTWENGRKPADMVAVVDAIAGGLGVDRAWLMWGKANAPTGGGGGRVSMLEEGRTRRDSNPQPSDPKVGGSALGLAA